MAGTGCVLVLMPLSFGCPQAQGQKEKKERERADEVTWSEDGASSPPREPDFSISASAHCSPTHRVETTSSSWEKKEQPPPRPQKQLQT